MGDEAAVERSGPPHGQAHRVAALGAGRPAAAPGRVHGGQDVLGGRPLHLELEVEVLAVADQPVDAAGEPDAVLLEPVAQPGLGDPLTLLELEGEPVRSSKSSGSSSSM